MKRPDRLFDLQAFSYSYFRWLGIPILRIFTKIPDSLKAANKKVHPEAYASEIGFLLVLSVIISDVLAVLLWGIIGPYAILLPINIPLAVLALMVYSPAAAAKSRASSLDTEVPYAAAYITVMSTGGVSAIKSFERLKDVELLPQVREAAAQMDIDVKAFGVDPITAMKKSGEDLPSKEYKEFVLGYASTTIAGGDVTHYLMRKTQTFFEGRAAKFRIMGERIAMLMEGFITITVLLALGVYSLFIVSKLIPAQLPIFSVGTFVIFAYILLPVTGALFIYFADIIQPRYPLNDWRSYKIMVFALPLLIAGLVLFVLPSITPSLAQVIPTYTFLVLLRESLGLQPGFEASLGLSLTFLLYFGVLSITDYRYSREGGKILSGLTSFQRDFVEIRKTGMSPERCIANLSSRNFGGFTPHLKILSNQIGWGLPLSKISQSIAGRIRGWVARMNLFLLVDAVDVGGGTPETLETLATFGESVQQLENEKKMALRPLMLIPYIGGVILVVSTLMMLSFMANMASVAGLQFAQVEFVRLFVPPLVLQSMITGIVAGKVAEEKVSAGFKHAFVLVLLTLVFAIMTPLLVSSISFS